LLCNTLLMNNKIDERMKTILVMFSLYKKKLPVDLQEFIYSSLKLSYLDGRIDGLESILKPSSIDGLSGEEEFLALKD